jgi:hypothetical protein
LTLRNDQQHNMVTHGAGKGGAIWVDAITDDSHIQVK